MSELTPEKLRKIHDLLVQIPPSVINKLRSDNKSCLNCNKSIMERCTLGRDRMIIERDARTTTSFIPTHPECIKKFSDKDFDNYGNIY